MSIRILIADDHPIMLSGARAILEQDPAISVAAQADSPDALMEATDRQAFDLVVTDLNMAGQQMSDGLHMLQALRRRHPRLPLVVLTQQGDPAVLEAVMQCGVDALVHKSDALLELLPAVHAAVQGRHYLSHYVEEQIGADGGPARPDVLTRREADVLRLFANGRTVKEIARQLHRSVKTVSDHKTSAMAKLGLETDLDIYRYARDHGMLA